MSKSIALVALVVAPLLSACGGTDSGSVESQDSMQTAATVPENLFVVSPCAEPCMTPPPPASAPATVFRGSRVDLAGARYLRDTLNVGVIIDLEQLHAGSNDDVIDALNKEAGARQIKNINFGMGTFGSPDDKDVNAVLSDMADAMRTGVPIYVHCALGRDRTGMMIALHRVINEKWTAQDAYDEWHRHDFDANWIRKEQFKVLFDYFEKRAGKVKRA